MKIYRARRYRRYRMPEEYRTTRRSRRYRKKRPGARRTVSAVALLVVIAGLSLVGYYLLWSEDALVPRAVSSATKSEELAASAPKDTTLKLTIPKMARVNDLPVYDAPWDSETALDVSASHLDSSGFPWQDEANIYISGHRMGFPGTQSFLVFYDLDVLEKGDEVLLTDANGTKYSYKVSDKYVADPYDWHPTETVPGKNVVTLQTCTLPDYTQRLIVQAELTESTPGAGSSQEEKPTTKTDSPQEVAPQGEEVAPQEGVAPQAAPQGPAPEAVPQEEVTPEAIPQEEIAPQAVPPQGVAPQGVAPQEGITPGAIPQEGVTPEAGSPQGLAPGAA